ncbi:hypothetical protein AB3Y13_02270 [Vibrio alginolyticus]|nr:hypothetical protein [Vibrio sp. B1FLJ16]CAD7818324.1 hypothetical protein ACOMICROBIO_EPCKBFOG_03349 [Vibrio sp. B1FLJ16]CAD7819310.1 hypothetical protein ACOMICROBIO_FLGHMIGD_03887 [Vibrio sp. B1FLJ16]CAE6934131.1 hypothetical protein ACOMICROBIO_EPCKBFOG_03349 [Vibrio sp. B1FLJ16]CAE6938260.1 hypothetical protein ACOMICROBIO_FLGHMIGD_03887 [Vibrio sp. B1FLJ16]
MKHFLPSTIMLTPFLVRYYDEEAEDENEVVETNQSLKEKEQQTEIIE